MRRRVLTISAGAGIAGIVMVGAAMGGIPPGFPLDDAWIHMVYGRSLAHGAPFAFNPGESASGATSPLWAVGLALVHLALESTSVAGVVRGAQLLGALAHVASACGAGLLARDWTRSNAAGSTAGALVGVSPVLASAALSGMEVSAAAASLCFALLAFRHGRALQCGLSLATAIAIRPEAVMVAALLGVIAIRSRAAPRTVARGAAPVTVAIGALVAGNVLASGRPLPATFYLKEQTSFGDLPSRLATILLEMLPLWAPFCRGIALLLLVGVVGAPRRIRWGAAAPLLTGIGWIAASALVIAPIDPAAFYHQRYLLPAVPVLVAACAIGAHHAGGALAKRIGRAREILVAGLLAVGLVSTASTVGPVGRHHASDVRNIDEVQRAMGVFLAAQVRPGARIAASDVGAVRYFSGRPVIDLMGLNTPELVWSTEAFVRSHPVTHVALMPSWLRPTRAGALEVVALFETQAYTVTSDPRMARQLVAACRAAAVVHFVGIRRSVVRCQPAD